MPHPIEATKSKRERFMDVLDRYHPNKLSTNDVIYIADKAVEIFGIETPASEGESQERPTEPGRWQRADGEWDILVRDDSFAGWYVSTYKGHRKAWQQHGKIEFLPKGGWSKAVPPFEQIDSKLDTILGLVPSDMRQHSLGVVDCVKRLRADWERLLQENHLMRHGHKEADALACLSDIAALRAKIDSLFSAVAHGDDEHRNWLRQAIDDHFAGREVAAVVGKGSKETIASLTAERDALLETQSSANAAIVGKLKAAQDDNERLRRELEEARKGREQALAFTRTLYNERDALLDGLWGKLYRRDYQKPRCDKCQRPYPLTVFQKLGRDLPAADPVAQCAALESKLVAAETELTRLREQLAKVGAKVIVGTDETVLTDGHLICRFGRGLDPRYGEWFLVHRHSKQGFEGYTYLDYGIPEFPARSASAGAAGERNPT